MDVLKRVNRELNQEMRKQVDLIYSAAAIAFARYWDKGWGPERIRELALSIERRAGIAPDADGLRQIREWATEIVCQCDMVERVQEQAEPAWKSELQDAFLRSHKNVVMQRCRS